ncbi:MAG: 2-dehydropantoate 2-reductase [Pseudomonadota bacterium]
MSDVSKDPTIVIAGAGSIGCYVGGRLQQSGRRVKFLGRERIKNELIAHGLTLTDLNGHDHQIAAADLDLSVSPDVLSQADIILVTVKSGATVSIGEEINRLASPDAVVVSLQNGVTNAQKLEQSVGGRRVVAGMVPFNVAQLGEGRFHQGTSGEIVIAAGTDGLRGALTAPPIDVVVSDDMPAVMWGKLLLNLNNALNALSGLPLKQQIETRAWRRLLADQLAETLRVLKAAEITPYSALPIPPKFQPHLMRLPTPIFKILAARMLKIDPLARSSMWEDLQQGRTTEIDELQGAVIGLAARIGRSAPICARVSDLVKQAEQTGAGSPDLSVAQVREGL